MWVTPPWNKLCGCYKRISYIKYYIPDQISEKLLKLLNSSFQIMFVIVDLYFTQMDQENKENNFRKSIILGLCVFLSYSTYAKETFSFFYLYNSTFFHEATFIYMRNSQDTHTYVHAYNAFIKKVKLRVIK